MTPFEHLSVLISIILGLGVTHLLSNVHGLVQGRDRVRVHWLPVAWAVLVFISLVQWWWASFGMREYEQWNFFYFLFILLRPVMLYLTAAFVLPRLRPGETCDLLTYYFANRRWLFLLLAGGNLLDGLRRMMTGEALGDVSVWSNFVSAVPTAWLAFTVDPRAHRAVTLLLTVLFLLFILDSALELV